MAPGKKTFPSVKTLTKGRVKTKKFQSGGRTLSRKKASRMSTRLRSFPPGSLGQPYTFRSCDTVYDTGVWNSLQPLSGAAVIIMNEIPLRPTAGQPLFYERAGMRIFMQSLQYSVWVTQSGLGAGTSTSGTTGTSTTSTTLTSDFANDSMGRVFIVYDSATNGALPGVTDIVSGFDVNGNVISPQALAYRNPGGSDRFKILMDRTLPLKGSSYQAGVSRPFYPGDHACTEFFWQDVMPLNLPATFDDSLTEGGALFNVQTGGIFIVFFATDRNGAPIPPCQYRVRGRINFYC
jgi:hypothetical protein